MPGSVLFRGIRMIDGRALKEGDDKAVILGRVVAMTLEKKAGDPLADRRRSFHGRRHLREQ